MKKIKKRKRKSFCFLFFVFQQKRDSLEETSLPEQDAIWIKRRLSNNIFLWKEIIDVTV